MPAAAKPTLRSMKVQSLSELLAGDRAVPIMEATDDFVDAWEAEQVRKQIRFERGVRRTAYLLWSLVIALAGWLLVSELAKL